MVNVPVTCVCDSTATGSYEYKNVSYKIISPLQLIKDYQEAFVLITTWKYEREIKEHLLGLGFPRNQIYFLRYHKTLSLDLFRDKYFDGYDWAYNFFTDTTSKQRILDRIKLLLWGIPVPPDSLYKDGYFAFPYIELTDNEVYIDGGAFTGDTAEEFINAVCAYRHIYSFEPDPKNNGNYILDL
jgi:hypothetical protein